MLIQFSVTNFRSFKGTETLSLVAGAGDELRATNVAASEGPAYPDLLRTAAIYGPNAAGKTNILRAVQVMQGIILGVANAKAPLLYTPHKFSRASRRQPTEFEIAFVQEGRRFEYGFAYDAERVVDEWLYEADQAKSRKLFERTYRRQSDDYEWSFGRALTGKKSIWQYSTRPDALFLSTAIQLNNTQLKPVYEWFQRRLVVVVGAIEFNVALTLQLLEQPDGKERILPFLNAADLGITDFQTEREPAQAMMRPNAILERRDGGPINEVKVKTYHKAEGDERVDLDLDDKSAGTQTLFRSAGAWLNVLKNGEVLLFDEIETSLHTLLTVFLIRRFHSRSSNPRNAQLVFSTHNTALLNQRLFRRDQIWFAERDVQSASHLTPLSDFSPRKEENLERAYLNGRYNALPLVDERF